MLWVWVSRAHILPLLFLPSAHPISLKQCRHSHPWILLTVIAENAPIFPFLQYSKPNFKANDTSHYFLRESCWTQPWNWNYKSNGSRVADKLGALEDEIFHHEITFMFWSLMIHLLQIWRTEVNIDFTK